MAAPDTTNEVTVRRLSQVVTGTWEKVKDYAVSDVAWDSTNGKLTKTKNGTTSDVVTKSNLLSALGGSIASGNTGFVTGGSAYTELEKKANTDSPTFTGEPKAPTATAGTNTTQIATTAFVKAAVDTAIAGISGDLTYKGAYAGGSTGAYGALTPAAVKGDVYKVSTAGKLDGVAVEVGDMIICNSDTDAATSSDYATVAAKWDFIQANIDGAVSGPSSSVNNRVAVFDGTTGKHIKDSGYTIATSVPSGAVFTDTDTKVTSVGNHYTPTGGTSKSASGGSASELPTSSTGSLVQVLTGVTVDAAGHVTAVSSKGLWSPNTTYESKAEAAGGTALSLCTNGEKYTWNNKQDLITDLNDIRTQASGAVRYDTTQSLTTDQKTQARSNIGAGTSNLDIGTSSSTAAAGNHAHGNITNAGAITASAALATDDALVFTDSSDSNKLKKTSITFDGSTATQALTKKGTWETFNNYVHPSGAGSKHIPSGGSSGQFLGWSADGTATWVANPNTDTKVTSSSNHYTPSTASGSDKSASASGATAAWGIDVVKGVTLNTDGKGHVTGISVTSGKIPSNPNTDKNVKQNLLSTSTDGNYPLLAKNNTTATDSPTGEANYAAGVTVNPSTNTITATTFVGSLTGTASAASSAASGSALETAINGKVPTSRTINSKALTGNITLTASDVGAATSGHTHDISIATDSGTNQLTLAANTKYKLTAGGKSYIFTTPPDTNTTYVFDGTYDSSTNKAATVSSVTSRINALDVTVSGMGVGKTLATLTETDGKIAATFQNISISKSQITDFPSSMTPTAHASSSTTYGVGTTSNYGHVKLITGDLNGKSAADGIAAAQNHTHSQYQTVLTEMTDTEVSDLLAALT